jgi:SAM-dependent methyltransferase
LTVRLPADLRRRYRRQSLRTRAHVALRWAACPFEALVPLVAGSGTVLDLGCGHGALSLHLAASCDVVGVDIDPRKVEAARAAAAHPPARAAFAVGRWPDEPFDGAVVVDVLYLLPPAEQEALVRRLARSVRTTLVVKEMAPTPRWKHRWNRVQELLAVRVLRLTASDHGVGRTDPDAIAAWMADEGLAVRHLALDRWRPWPHHAVVGQAPPRGGPSQTSTASAP